MQNGAHFFQKLLIYDPAKRIRVQRGFALFLFWRYELGRQQEEKKVGLRECLQADNYKRQNASILVFSQRYFNILSSHFEKKAETLFDHPRSSEFLAVSIWLQNLKPGHLVEVFYFKSNTLYS